MHKKFDITGLFIILSTQWSIFVPVVPHNLTFSALCCYVGLYWIFYSLSHLNEGCGIKFYPTRIKFGPVFSGQLLVQCDLPRRNKSFTSSACMHARWSIYNRIHYPKFSGYFFYLFLQNNCGLLSIQLHTL